MFYRSINPVLIQLHRRDLSTRRGGLESFQYCISCDRRTGQFPMRNNPVHISLSRSLRHSLIRMPAITGMVLVFLLAILCLGGCTDAHAETQTNSAQPDMTLNNYEAGCSTVGCHQQLTRTKWVHAPAATGDCAACHEETGKLDEHVFEPVVLDDSSCKLCHSFDESPESIHEPFELGTCYDCHDPHGGDRKSFIVAQTTEALCATCHDKVANNFNHHPVNQGDCQTCHEPHQSEHQHLLVQSQRTLCYGCHQDMDHGGVLGHYQRGNLQANVHAPLLEEGCTACHAPHGSDVGGMLLKDQRAVCLDCHEAVVENLPLAESIHGAFGSEQACTHCHLPHASELQGLLAVPTTILCYTCHDQEIESESGETILNMKELIEESAVVHEPAALGECMSCHVSHFSPQHSLLRDMYPNKEYAVYEPANYAMCLECHDAVLIESEFTTLTGFRDGDRNLHYVHTHREKGRACGLCHQSHAGSLPSLMREQVPFGSGGWSLPIGFEKTPFGGTCASPCHDQQSYNNTDSP